MHLLDLTLPTPEENLALDEALLEEAEAGGAEVLRLWESPRPLVVIGRSSKIDSEVDRGHCRRAGVPVLRRCSGGAAVVAGPGCLMYAVVLKYDQRDHLRMINRAHQFVMGRNAEAVNSIVPPASAVEVAGISDLAWGPRRQKVSGNSLRCKRSSLLYHGTLLYDFALPLIHQCLGLAPRQPDYRQGRDHDSFVANLHADAQQLRDALVSAWRADSTLPQWPRERTQQLAEERYRQTQWNEKI